MADPIKRGDTWWHRQDDGSWLRWDDADQQWKAAPGPPPAPPGPTLESSPTATLPLPVAPTASPPRTAELPSLATKTRGPSPAFFTVLGVALLAGATAAYLAFVSSDDTADDPPLERAPGVESPVAPVEESVPASDKQAYITALDTVCARVIAAQSALREPQGRRGLIRYTEKVHALNRAAYKQMRKVPLPEDGRKIAQRLLALYANALDYLGQGVKAVRKDDAPEFGKALAQAARAGRRYNAIATGYGFQECNKDR